MVGRRGCVPQHQCNGLITIRIGFCGILYYSYIRRNPQTSIGNYLGPYIILLYSGLLILWSDRMQGNEYPFVGDTRAPGQAPKQPQDSKEPQVGTV